MLHASRNLAITFVQQKKRQQYLLFVFAGVVLLSLVILWRGFLTAPAPAPAEPEAKPELFREIEVDFDIFNHPFFAQIEEFPRIPDFQVTGDVKVGRENPFAPVGAKEETQIPETPETEMQNSK